MRQEDEADGPQETGKAQEPEGSAEKAGSKKDKYQKAQAKPVRILHLTLILYFRTM